MASRLEAEIETVQAGRRATWRIGKLVRAYRQTRGLTQAEMARRLGLTAQSLCDVELGRRSLSAQKLLKLQSLLEGGSK